MNNDALELALALHRAPIQRFALRGRPLPADIGSVIQLASGKQPRLGEAASRFSESETTVLEAARFYLQQVLFDQEDDAYRTLGLDIDAPPERVRTHYHWLQRWLHPDRRGSEEWEALFATRVNWAWSQLRTESARSAYDLERHNTTGSDKANPAANQLPVREWLATPIEQPPVNWMRRGVVGAALAGCALLLAVAVLRDQPVHGDWALDTSSSKEIAATDVENTAGLTVAERTKSQAPPPSITEAVERMSTPELAHQPAPATRRNSVPSTRPQALTAESSSQARSQEEDLLAASIPQPKLSTSLLQQREPETSALQKSREAASRLSMVSESEGKRLVAPEAIPATSNITMTNATALPTGGDTQPAGSSRTAPSLVADDATPMVVKVEESSSVRQNAPPPREVTAPTRLLSAPVANSPEVASVESPSAAAKPPAAKDHAADVQHKHARIVQPDAPASRVDDGREATSQAEIVPPLPPPTPVIGPDVAAALQPEPASAMTPSPSSAPQLAAMAPETTPEPMIARKASGRNMMPEDPPASSLPPEDLVARVEIARQRVTDLVAYMRRMDSGVPPWSDVRARAHAQNARNALRHRNGIDETATFTLDEPKWWVTDEMAELDTTYRLRGGAEKGRVIVDLVWYGQNWQLTRVDLQPTP